MNQLSFPDYLVILAYLVGLILLGFVFSKRQTSPKEYFLASKNIPWWAAGMSIFATLLSAQTFLGGPGWVFARDSRFLITGSVIGLGTVALAAAIWVPLWQKLPILSIYEYLERRFHPGLRIVGALFFLCNCTFWMGNALVIAAQGFNAATGVSIETGIWCIVLLTMVYTTLGGARAVIWSDVAQFLLLLLTYIVIAWLLLAEFQWHPQEIYNIASSKTSEITGYPHTTMVSFEFNFTIEATFWALLFSQLILSINYGADQIYVQKMLSTNSKKSMSRVLMSYGVWTLVFGILSTMIAWGMIAFYDRHPDLSSSLSHPDQVLPHFVVSQVPVIIRGLIMAGILAAMMSTLSSVINSMSTVTTIDFFSRYLTQNNSERYLTLISKFSSVFHAILLLSFAIWQSSYSEANVVERHTKLVAMTNAPVAAFFFLGIISKRTNTPGVLIGAAAGVTAALLLVGFQGFMEPLIQGVNFFWVNGISMIVSLIVGFFSSLLFKPRNPESIKQLTIR